MALARRVCQPLLALFGVEARGPGRMFTCAGNSFSIWGGLSYCTVTGLESLHDVQLVNAYYNKPWVISGMRASLSHFQCPELFGKLLLTCLEIL
jgi:hypothetical protein